MYGMHLYDKVPEVLHIECETKIDQLKVWDKHP